MPDWAVFDEAALGEGFTILPNLVLRLPIHPAAKLLYVILLRYAWAKTEFCPSQVDLAREMGTTDKTIRRWLAALEDAGLIQRESKVGEKDVVRFLSLSEAVILTGVKVTEVATPVKVTGVTPVKVTDGTPVKVTDFKYLSKYPPEDTEEGLSQTPPDRMTGPDPTDTPRDGPATDTPTDAKPTCPWCANPTPATGSEVQRLAQVYHDSYRAAHEVCPTIKMPRDGSLLKMLLQDGRSFDHVAAVLTHGVHSADKLLRETAWRLGLILTNFDAIAKALREGRQHGGQQGGRRPGREEIAESWRGGDDG